VFHTATEEEIKAGKITDIYFARTMEILNAKGIDKKVVAEVRAKGLAKDWGWAVLAGIEECANLLEGLDVSVRSLREGTIFRAGDPVMEIMGNYKGFCVYETAILGFLCQASGVATAAARCRKAAGERPVISFGARRMHPAISPMIERNAFIGGCDGVAVKKSAELIGEEASGTMPHALILLMGDTVEATRAFNEVIDKKVKRVSLVDTLADEKFESLRVAEALGEDLFAVRLDTPSSRRGNFRQIFEEVRWELDLRGFDKVKLFASGGLDEDEIQELNPAVDAYGVGTAISNAPVVDFSMDIMEIEGQPVAKRGKESGRKRLLRCPKCFRSGVSSYSKSEGRCECGEKFNDLLEPLTEEGKLVRSLPRAQEIRKYVLEELRFFDL
jgi:nicotinate phosphoribosyltransferase